MINQSSTSARNQQGPSPAGVGYVIVNVTTARGAIPIPYATVRIFDYENGGENGSLIITAKTNSSGRTEKIPLSAPPRSDSLSPGNGRSYKTYNIDAQYDGYYNQYYINVPIFDGITAVQSIDLVPVAENGTASTLDSRFYETENPNLE